MSSVGNSRSGLHRLPPPEFTLGDAARSIDRLRLDLDAVTEAVEAQSVAIERQGHVLRKLSDRFSRMHRLMHGDLDAIDKEPNVLDEIREWRVTRKRVNATLAVFWFAIVAALAATIWSAVVERHEGRASREGSGDTALTRSP